MPLTGADLATDLPNRGFSSRNETFGSTAVSKFFAAAAVAALCMAGTAQASELLSNGTFDAGNTGFQSGYAYALTHDLYPAGTYDVITNPRPTTTSAPSPTIRWALTPA